jgi:hypothetical protein
MATKWLQNGYNTTYLIIYTINYSYLGIIYGGAVRLKSLSIRMHIVLRCEVLITLTGIVTGFNLNIC